LTGVARDELHSCRGIRTPADFDASYFPTYAVKTEGVDVLYLSFRTQQVSSIVECGKPTGISIVIAVELLITPCKVHTQSCKSNANLISTVPNRPLQSTIHNNTTTPLSIKRVPIPADADSRSSLDSTSGTQRRPPCYPNQSPPPRYIHPG
jgi:hypothetical protein